MFEKEAGRHKVDYLACKHLHLRQRIRPKISAVCLLAAQNPCDRPLASNLHGGVTHWTTVQGGGRPAGHELYSTLQSKWSHWVESNQRHRPTSPGTTTVTQKPQRHLVHAELRCYDDKPGNRDVKSGQQKSIQCTKFPSRAPNPVWTAHFPLDHWFGGRLGVDSCG